MTYFAIIDGKQEGPFSEQELRQKIGQGVDNQTLIWKEGMPEWTPLGQVFGLSAHVAASPSSSSSQSWVLASLGQRFLAALVDACPFIILAVLAGIAGPLFGVSSEAADSSEPPVALLALMGVVGLLFLGILVVQIFLLAKYSQTIGKRVIGIRIYDFQTKHRANWVKTILLRGVVNGIIGGIPFIGGFYALVDICFIFRQDRRCIHDLIAGTQVGTVPKS